MKINLTATIIILTIASAIYAAGEPMAFLKLGAGARATGMGGAYTAVSDDAVGVFYNPSGLAALKSLNFTAETYFLTFGRSVNYISACKDFDLGGHYYTAGLSWYNYSAGNDIEARSTDSPLPERKISDNTHLVVLTAATALSDRFYAGMNARLDLRVLDDIKAAGFGFDAGVMLKIIEGLQAGICASNISANTWWDNNNYNEPVPAEYSFGLAYSRLDIFGVPKLGALVALDYAVNAFGFMKLRFGAEIKANDFFFLRAGYNGGFSAGCGMVFRPSDRFSVKFDYALLADNILDASLNNRVGVTVDLVTDAAAAGAPAAAGKKGKRMKNRGRFGINSKFKIKNSKLKREHTPRLAPLISKKTILFPEYFPFIAGGQVVTLNIIRHLKKKYNIRVILFNRGTMERELGKLGIACDHMAAPKSARVRYFWRSIPLYFKLKGYLRKNKIDLVYATGYFTAKLCGPAARAASVPMIWHKHQIMEGPAASYLNRQVAKYARNASRIICISNASKRSMEAIGVAPEKLEMVYNGVSSFPAGMRQGVRRRTREKYGIGSAFLCGTVCMLRQNKGLELLIKAAEKVLEKAPGIKFMLVGSAEPGNEAYETRVRGLAGQKLPAGSFIFTGFGDRNLYMPAFDLYVMPSPNEPFGLVTVEAFAAGVPAAGFDTGGTGEIIKDGFNGLLAGKVDPKVLAEKILQAFSNMKKLKAMGRNAEKTASRIFSLGGQMEKIGIIVENTIAGGGSL